VPSVSRWRCPGRRVLRLPSVKASRAAAPRSRSSDRRVGQNSHRWGRSHIRLGIHARSVCRATAPWPPRTRRASTPRRTTRRSGWSPPPMTVTYTRVVYRFDRMLTRRAARSGASRAAAGRPPGTRPTMRRSRSWTTHRCWIPSPLWSVSTRTVIRGTSSHHRSWIWARRSTSCPSGRVGGLAAVVLRYCRREIGYRSTQRKAQRQPTPVTPSRHADDPAARAPGPWRRPFAGGCRSAAGSGLSLYHEPVVSRHFPRRRHRGK
jgi:hypothetical protein